MKKVVCRQGTQEWLDARSGVITASNFFDVTSKMTRSSEGRKAGDPTAKADRYCADVAAEQILGEPFSEPAKAWILERGHALEDEARALYMERTGSVVYEQGFVTTDCGAFGYSTDGEVDDSGLIEIKCPIDTLKIAAMLGTHDVSEYMHQIQGGMWITGRKWCDLVMYAPMLAPVGNDLIITRVRRDEEFIKTMVDGLIEALARAGYYKKLFTKGA